MTDPNQQPPKDVADAALDEVVGGVQAPRDPASGYLGETEKRRSGRPAGFQGDVGEGTGI